MGGANHQLVDRALKAVPNEGPFAEGMRDVIAWCQEDGDWRITRQRIHEKYNQYKNGDYEAPSSPVSSLQNGLCGIMAILYGEGDFMKTTGIAVSAGYDCDNQGATCAGLIGVMQGADCIPDFLTKELPRHGKWDKPFNDRYLNYSRDGLPIVTKISDIVSRITAIAEKAILKNGGRIVRRDGQIWYEIHSDF